MKKIIIKYDLQPSRQQIGASLHNNVSVFERNGVFFAQCNTCGEPAENVLIWSNGMYMKCNVDVLFGLQEYEFSQIMAAFNVVKKYAA